MLPSSPQNNQQLNMLQEFSNPQHHKPSTINHQPPLPFPIGSLQTHHHFSESDLAASDFLWSLLNDNIQKMVEFTTGRGFV
jgi:hypothetical protein